MNNEPVLELVLFRTQPKVSAAALLEASATLNAVLNSMPGFLSRELFSVEDGTWIDSVRWRSLDEAKSAAKAVMSMPAAQALFALLDHSSITMLHGSSAQKHA